VLRWHILETWRPNSIYIGNWHKGLEYFVIRGLLIYLLLFIGTNMGLKYLSMVLGYESVEGNNKFMLFFIEVGIDFGNMYVQ
jgi:hypothetical protein